MYFPVITSILTMCQQAKPINHFKLEGADCGHYHRVDSIQYTKLGLSKKYAPTPTSFIWGKYDPIVEAGWSTVDFVHGYCAPYFWENFPHFHMYLIAMEALFPVDPIQRHW